MAYDKVVDSQALDGALTAVADAIRSKTGRTETMTLEQMPGEITGIQTGTVLPELSNPGAEEDLMEGKELLDGAGEPVVGAFTLAAELAAQDALLAQISEALDGVVGGSAADPTAGYTRLEYVASDGAAYVLTDFVADNTCGAEMVVSFPHFADHTWMGSREDSGSTRFFAPYAYSASIWYAGFNGNVKISASTAINTIYRCQINFLDSRLTTVHDEAGTLKGSTSLSDTLTAHSYPICIFTQNYEGIPRTPRIFNLYSVRCSRGYEVVREYIPCRRESDGMVGLFEKYTGTFLEPQGGTLTAGPDVDW